MKQESLYDQRLRRKVDIRLLPILTFVLAEFPRSVSPLRFLIPITEHLHRTNITNAKLVCQQFRRVADLQSTTDSMV